MKRQNLMQSILMLACCALLSTSQFSLKVFGQESFQTTAVSLKPVERKYSKCLARVVFNDFITANAAGTVKYKFVRSDEAETDVVALEFKKAGTMAVSDSWMIGSVSRATHIEGWEAIQILSPNAMESSHDEGAFAVHCEKGSTVTAELPPAPTVISNPARRINEKIELKKGEKFERDGLIEPAQKSYVYAVHLEKGQVVNLEAVFRDNAKPNSVFRDNTNPAVEVRGIYKGGNEEMPLIGSAGKDGKWSGMIQESGDYLIVVARPPAKDGGEQTAYPYRLLVWTN